MAFPQVVGSALSSNPGANAVDDTVDLPAGVAAGDLILVFHMSDGVITRTFPSPWVEIRDALSNSSVCNIGIAYLIASGGETSVVVTKSATERFTAIAIRISASSWHGTTPPEASAGAVASGTTPNPDSLDPSGWDNEDTLWIAAMIFDDPAGTGTVDAYPFADNNIKATATASAAGGAICTTESAVASIDPGSFTTSGGHWWAGTVAVRPAVAVVTPFPPFRTRIQHV